MRTGPLLGALLVAFTAACERNDEPPTADRILPEGIDSSVAGMRTIVTREGIRRAVVESDTAEWHSESEIHLRPMKITFYDANGRESTEVTSEYGVFHELTGDLEAEGSVIALDRVDGQRLETERLRYVNAESRLYGSTAFRLHRGPAAMLIEGSSFESDPTLDSVIVLNPAGESRPRVVPVPALPDTAMAPADTTGAPPDTTAVPPDTTGAPPDTTGAPPDTTGAPPDTLVRR